ncbi:hypothetical protein GKZ90_0007910 [Flavobacterium sp. MC2016-06]|uniref:hypothetical protein n=1 Tax=Flavobacterium sp. MC2016-06 TaxID=2676308 RepID=UPI0012BA907A|nr:hypothetical protein [Flavobacterium sp. MC2016-06]MBU3858045.1 hypothetical protein [Flavobacterium sp. MC2016-06]
MKTLDKNSKTIQWLSDIESNSIQDIQTETMQHEEFYLTDQKTLLFQMYELEEEDLFV